MGAGEGWRWWYGVGVGWGRGRGRGVWAGGRIYCTAILTQLPRLLERLYSAAANFSNVSRFLFDLEVGRRGPKLFQKNKEKRFQVAGF